MSNPVKVSLSAKEHIRRKEQAWRAKGGVILKSPDGDVKATPVFKLKEK